MSVDTFEGAEADQGVVDRLVAKLEPGETPVAAACVTRFQLGAFRANDATVLLTSHRLAVAKDRLFGGPKIDRELRLQELTRSGSGLLNGVGPTLEVQVEAGRKWASMYFRNPIAGESFERRVRNTASLMKAVGS